MRKRNVSILIRVTDTEFELINKKAQKANCNRNDYIVNMIITPRKAIGDPLKHVLKEMKSLNKALMSLPYESASESEKSAIMESEILIEKMYQEVYHIARKGVT